MKHAFFLVFTFACVYAYGQPDAPIVKGKKVKSVLQYNIMYLYNDTLGAKLCEENRYNKKGNQVKHITYLSNTPIASKEEYWREEFTYNKSGLITSTINTNNKTGKTDTITYKYTKQKGYFESTDRNGKDIGEVSFRKAGNIATIKHYGLDGKFFSSDSITYNAKYQMVLYVILSGKYGEYNYYNYYTYTPFDSLEARYDVRKLKKQPYSVDTSCIYRYTYDNKKRLLTETYMETGRKYDYQYSYNADGSSTKTLTEENNITTSVYNVQGLLIEETKENNALLYYNSRFIYNSDNLLIAEERRTKDTPFRTIKVYEYTYW